MYSDVDVMEHIPEATHEFEPSLDRSRTGGQESAPRGNNGVAPLGPPMDSLAAFESHYTRDQRGGVHQEADVQRRPRMGGHRLSTSPVALLMGEDDMESDEDVGYESAGVVDDDGFGFNYGAAMAARDPRHQRAVHPAPTGGAALAAPPREAPAAPAAPAAQEEEDEIDAIRREFGI